MQQLHLSFSALSSFRPVIYSIIDNINHYPTISSEFTHLAITDITTNKGNKITATVVFFFTFTEDEEIQKDLEEIFSYISNLVYSSKGYDLKVRSKHIQVRTMTSEQTFSQP